MSENRLPQKKKNDGLEMVGTSYFSHFDGHRKLPRSSRVLAGSWHWDSAAAASACPLAASGPRQGNIGPEISATWSIRRRFWLWYVFWWPDVLQASLVFSQFWGVQILAPTYGKFDQWEWFYLKLKIVKDNPKLRQPTFLDLYNFKQGKKPKKPKLDDPLGVPKSRTYTKTTSL